MGWAAAGMWYDVPMIFLDILWWGKKWWNVMKYMMEEEEEKTLAHILQYSPSTIDYAEFCVFHSK